MEREVQGLSGDGVRVLPGGPVVTRRTDLRGMPGSSGGRSAVNRGARAVAELGANSASADPGGRGSSLSRPSSRSAGCNRLRGAASRWQGPCSAALGSSSPHGRRGSPARSPVRRARRAPPGIAARNAWSGRFWWRLGGDQLSRRASPASVAASHARVTYRVWFRYPTIGRGWPLASRAAWSGKSGPGGRSRISWPRSSNSDAEAWTRRINECSLRLLPFLTTNVRPSKSRSSR